MISVSSKIGSIDISSAGATITAAVKNLYDYTHDTNSTIPFGTPGRAGVENRIARAFYDKRSKLAYFMIQFVVTTTQQLHYTHDLEATVAGTYSGRLLLFDSSNAQFVGGNVYIYDNKIYSEYGVYAVADNTEAHYTLWGVMHKDS